MYSLSVHVRWSSLVGMPVIDDDTQETVALLTDPLIHPDTGRILGFFVLMMSGDATGTYFLATADILSIGTKVHIRTVDRLSPPDELVRLQSAFDDVRTVLGQRIRVRESGRTLGVCADLQFDTRHFAIEWLFPRGLIFFKQPVAATDIQEITAEAIFVVGPYREKKELAVEPKKEDMGLLVAETAPALTPTSQP